MQLINLTAKSISAEHIESISPQQIHERVMSGQIIIVPRCLQAIGYFQPLQEASLEAIRQAVGEQKAAEVRNKGFEAIHEIIDLDELAAVSDSSYEVIRALAPTLSKLLVKKVFQQETAFYYEESPNVRFHFPYDIIQKNKQEFSKFYWNGKVTAHGPHHDSWYQCPTNSINVWIAIGSVKIGNGLTIYPQVYNKRLPCTKEGKILRNQYFGSAVNCELEPGDALIFHGEHLHSSEINSTNATRYVISMRMTLEQPEFIDDSPYQDNYIYSECNDGVSAKFTQSIADISRQVSKKIKSAVGKQKKQTYIISPEDIPAFDDTSSDFPKPIPVKKVKGDSDDETKIVFDSSQLPVGTIKPISTKMCVARLDEQRVVAFSRYCSHEGADLAGGYLRDGCIVCPWHNLAFSLDNGASKCQSLSKLNVVDCLEDNNTVEVTRLQS